MFESRRATLTVPTLARPAVHLLLEVSVIDPDREDDAVTLQLCQTFPTSDPPSWSPAAVTPTARGDRPSAPGLSARQAQAE